MKKGLTIAEIGIILVISFSGIVFASNLTITQELRAEVVSGKMYIYSPFFGGVYDKRMVPINISLSDFATKFRYAKYSDNGEKLVTLCRNCNEYGYSRLRKKPFDDGVHQMKIVGIFEFGEVESFVSLTVDTKDPKIKKMTPKQRGYADGWFEIEIEEANPVNLSIFYKDKSGLNNINVNPSVACKDISGGSKRARKLCKIFINLTDHPGEEIEYWAEVVDILGNKVVSKHIKQVVVDLKAPVVNNPETFYHVDKGYVYFDINISEDNFDEVLYKDLNDVGRSGTKVPKWKRLRSRLDKNNNCEKRIRYKGTSPLMNIKILDKAGNEKELDVLL